jgi:uroporphyrinogen-III synthase
MRVLVTRPQADAERTAKRLAAAGHDPLVAPLLSIVSTGHAPPESGWDAVIVTSAHAVAALASLDGRNGPVFAVGSRTAAAIREAGFDDVRVGAGDAASLAALVARSLPGNSVLLHIAGRHHKPEPGASLRDAGYAVRVWEAYEAQPVPRLPADVLSSLAAGRIDAALHYSRRSAALFVDLVGEAGLAPRLRAVAHLCLSADAAGALAGLEATVLVAAEPNETALLAALDAFARVKGSRRPHS